MRVIAILFALLLVTGLSFGGNSFFGSTSSIAQDDPAGEAARRRYAGRSDQRFGSCYR